MEIFPIFIATYWHSRYSGKMNELERPSRLLAATQVVLKPLVRLLLRNQVTYPALTGVLKELYVEVADQEFAIEGKRQTESRLSLLTGIHRKEVKRLRQEIAERATDETPKAVSLGGMLVASWLTTDGYQKDGVPLPIPRQSTNPGDVSFETLVETVGRQDIRPRAVLDEWLNLGMATVDDNDRVVLQQEAFIPRHGEEEKLFYWQRNLADHIQTASHNLGTQSEPLLERGVYYTRLSEEAIQQLHRIYQDEGMKLLKHLNQQALTLKQTHPGNQRMNAGLYFATESRPDSQQEAPPS